MKVKPSVAAALSALLPMLFVAAGVVLPETAGTSLEPAVPRGTTLSGEDQIFNDAGSTTAVRYSLVTGGLSPGSTDGGGNLDAAPLFESPSGDDNIPGTVDDAVSIQVSSPALDAGDTSLLPADLFDLDGDGDTAEPLPIDIAGMGRTVDGGAGSVDMGAHESDAVGVAIAPDPGVPVLPVEFEIPFPNPLSDRGEVRFRLPRSEPVRIEVYDVLGRLQATLFDEVAHRDRDYRLEIDAGHLASGAYFVRLQSASFDRAVSFVVAR